MIHDFSASVWNSCCDVNSCGSSYRNAASLHSRQGCSVVMIFLSLNVDFPSWFEGKATSVILKAPSRQTVHRVALLFYRGFWQPAWGCASKFEQNLQKCRCVNLYWRLFQHIDYSVQTFLGISFFKMNCDHYRENRPGNRKQIIVGQTTDDW